MRRGNRTSSRACYYVGFVGVIAFFVILNVYITLQYYRTSSGDRRPTSAPPTVSPTPVHHATAVPTTVATPPHTTPPPATEVQRPTETEEPQFYHVDATAWPYDSMEDMIKKTIPKKYWTAINEDTAGEEKAAVLKQRTGCDIMQVPFDPTNDKRCIDYLTDTSNWQELKPLPQKFDERTIKFTVNFKSIDGASPLASVLKVPQKLFQNEAFSETASYHADRVLQINRIPPTGWVCIPTTMIHAAVDKYGPTLETVDEFLKESRAKNYGDWVDIDLFRFAKDTGLVRTKDGVECIGASIQLFMADVHHLLDSHLKIPYIPHNASWMRHFDFNEKDGPDFQTERWAVSMVHLAEISMFDFIIGNPDRSPNKNNFVVGGCKRYCPKSYRLHHPGHPTYIHLDQGMGFYGSPSNNAITKARTHAKLGKGKNEMCLFRAPLANRVKYLLSPSGNEEVGTLFVAEMQKRLESDVMEQVQVRRLKGAVDRMKKLLGVIDGCRKASFRKYVIAP